jgi:hypothetical protein
MTNSTEPVCHRLIRYLFAWLKLAERRQLRRMRLWDPAVVATHEPFAPRPVATCCRDLPLKELPNKKAA